MDMWIADIQVPCMFQKLCIYVVTSYLLLKEKYHIVSCIYLNDSELLKVKVDKNKINIFF